MRNSMKELFPGYFKENDQSLKVIWEEALFVFDANILLNLYRYSNETGEEFFQILDNAKDRIWIPYQAAEEYLRNRLTVIGEQEKSYNDTISAITTLESKFDSARQHPFVSDSSLKDLKLMFSSLKTELEKNRDIHTTRMTSDNIKDKIAEIFEGRIGSSYKKEKLESIFIEGEQRYSQHVPPGYKDALKSKDRCNFQDECKKYGDLIVWKQVIENAVSNKKDVIFVTDDEKEDWWEVFKGKTIGPRPELTREFRDNTSKSILMYNSDSFVRFASEYLGEKVSEKTMTEIKQVREQDWLDSSFEAALSKYRTFYDLVSFIKENVNVGEKLPSERILAETVGWTRTVIREQLVRLESYGYIKIEHGKSTVLKKEIPDIPTTEIEDSE
jgi:hypothetical protein